MTALSKQTIDRTLRRALSRRTYDSLKGAYYGARVITRTNPGRGHTLPDFLIIGGAKCVTTSLHGWLVEHPSVARTEKEIHFFNINYYHGADWYRTHFPKESERAEFVRREGRPLLAGEGTPTYMAHYWTSERAAKLVPEAKLIVCLRDPIDRAYSQYHHFRRRGTEPIETFEEAIAAEPERLSGEHERQLRDRHFHSWKLHRWGYLFASRYDEQVERWLRFFPREQFLFLDFAEVSSAPQRALDRVHAFLGLPDHSYELFPKLNANSYEPIAAETRARLEEYFRPHNERLQEITGIDFGWEAS
jgi:hypothetical protein